MVKLLKNIFNKFHFIGFVLSACIGYYALFTNYKTGKELKKVIFHEQTRRVLLQLQSNIFEFEKKIDKKSSQEKLIIILEQTNLSDHLNDFKNDIIKGLKQIAIRPSPKGYENLQKSISRFNTKLRKTESLLWGKELKTYSQLLQRQKNSHYTYQAISTILSFTLIILMIMSYLSFKNEQELKKAKKIHSVIFKSLSEGVIFCDTFGKIETSNQSAGKIFDKSPQKLYQMSIFSLLNSIHNLTSVRPFILSC